MKSLRLLALAALLFAPTLRAQTLPPGAPPPRPTPPIATGGEVAAMTAAEVWLALVDDGQFEKSWDTGAKILQGVVTKESWVNLAKAKRPPLGKVVSRKVIETTPAKTLPGAPEGQYVVLQFTTEFEHKSQPRKRSPSHWMAAQWKCRATTFADGPSPHRPRGHACRNRIRLNLGDRQANLRRARNYLRALPCVSAIRAAGPLYETSPVGCDDSAGNFLNTVVEVDLTADASPECLLKALRQIEVALGRPSRRPRNASRSIDLDILYAGGRGVFAPLL